MVITPSLPTFSIAFAISSPISLSPLADIVPTCTISSDVLIILAMPFRFATTASTAIEIPRLRSMAFIPAATDLQPSLNIAFVRTVAHVVPSPAVSLVALATCFTRLAPTFFTLSLNSMLLATVTPSFVTLGAPKLCSIITVRPLGPIVTLTASANSSTPLIIKARASTPNLMSLAA
uniref:CPN60II n=1 Tax=Arundo donax TaxID=35708 RepID=A0A0A9HG95_ARUDO